MTEYRVALEVYNGPLDLLLYLIRREEIEIHDIPIARITAQYIEYVELLKVLDPEAVSEFLVLAATLMEIKSRMLLPTPPPEEGDDEIGDPRLELVRQLLEYKKFKDAARHLEDAADIRTQRHGRFPVLPQQPADEMDLESLDIWDLFEAFNRLLEQTGQRAAIHKVGIDDTPIALHAEDIVDAMQRAGGSIAFTNIFAGRTRAEMIGLFLALLELIRQKRIRVTQERPFETILIHLLDATPLDIDKAAAAFAPSEPAEIAPLTPVDEAVLLTDGEALVADGDVTESDDPPDALLDDSLADMGVIEPSLLDPRGSGDSDQPRPPGT